MSYKAVRNQRLDYVCRELIDRLAKIASSAASLIFLFGRYARRTLLLADPHLRRNQWQAGGGDPARKKPAGREVRTILKYVIGRIRGHWPEVRILVRSDSHYGRVEAMEWCEEHGVDYIFGFGGNAVLKALTQEAADVLCLERAARGRVRDREIGAMREITKRRAIRGKD